MQFAEQMTRADRDVNDDTFAQLKTLFTDAQLVELAAWVGLQTLYSTINRALRIT